MPHLLHHVDTATFGLRYSRQGLGRLTSEAANRSQVDTPLINSNINIQLEQQKQREQHRCKWLWGSRVRVGIYFMILNSFNALW